MVGLSVDSNVLQHYNFNRVKYQRKFIMKIKQIIFTEPNVAKLLDRESSELSDNEVLV